MEIARTTSAGHASVDSEHANTAASLQSTGTASTEEEISTSPKLPPTQPQLDTVDSTESFVVVSEAEGVDPNSGNPSSPNNAATLDQVHALASQLTLTAASIVASSMPLLIAQTIALTCEGATVQKPMALVAAFVWY